MKLMAKRYTESNPTGTAKVITYEARPMLRLVPPPGMVLLYDSSFLWSSDWTAKSSPLQFLVYSNDLRICEVAFHLIKRSRRTAY